MKKTVYSFSIGSSCHESWQQMSATEQGRFCLNCQKEVIDFSSLSDEEVIGVMEKAGGSVCGRFRTSQLNRPMTMLSHNVRRPSSLRAVIAGIVMLTVLHTAHEAEASSLKPLKAQLMQDREGSPQAIEGDSTNIYRGRVLSEVDSLPLTDAYVWFNNTNYPVDITGRFELQIPDSLVGENFHFDIIHLSGAMVVQVEPKDFNDAKEQVFYVREEVMMMGIVVPEFQTPKKRRKHKD